MLLGTDACREHAYFIDFPSSTISSRGRQFPVSATRQHTVTKSWKKRRIYAAQSYTIPPTHGHHIEIVHKYMTPHSNADALFLTKPTPQIHHAMGSWGSIPSALITAQTTHLPYANMGEIPIHIPKGQLLGYVESPRAISPTSAEINMVGQEDNVDQVDLPGQLPPDTSLDPQVALDADVSPEWGPEVELQVRHVLERHKYLFRSELGLFNDGIRMPIPFKDESNVRGLKQPAMRLSARDREAANSILDPMRATGRVQKVPWDRPSPVACPAFVVWNGPKPRLVVDLRRINERLIPDAYPLPPAR